MKNQLSLFFEFDEKNKKITVKKIFFFFLQKKIFPATPTICKKSLLFPLSESGFHNKPHIKIPTHILSLLWHCILL